jgi:hypothetical protein
MLGFGTKKEPPPSVEFPQPGAPQPVAKPKAPDAKPEAPHERGEEKSDVRYYPDETRAEYLKSGRDLAAEHLKSERIAADLNKPYHHEPRVAVPLSRQIPEETGETQLALIAGKSEVAVREASSEETSESDEIEVVTPAEKLQALAAKTRQKFGAIGSSSMLDPQTETVDRLYHALTYANTEWDKYKPAERSVLKKAIQVYLSKPDARKNDPIIKQLADKAGVSVVRKYRQTDPKKDVDNKSWMSKVFSAAKSVGKLAIMSAGKHITDVIPALKPVARVASTLTRHIRDRRGRAAKSRQQSEDRDREAKYKEEEKGKKRELELANMFNQYRVELVKNKDLLIREPHLIAVFESAIEEYKQIENKTTDPEVENFEAVFDRAVKIAAREEEQKRYDTRLGIEQADPDDPKSQQLLTIKSASLETGDTPAEFETVPPRPPNVRFAEPPPKPEGTKVSFEDLTPNPEGANDDSQNPLEWSNPHLFAEIKNYLTAADIDSRPDVIKRKILPLLTAFLRRGGDLRQGGLYHLLEDRYPNLVDQVSKRWEEDAHNQQERERITREKNEQQRKARDRRRQDEERRRHEEQQQVGPQQITPLGSTPFRPAGSSVPSSVRRPDVSGASLGDLRHRFRLDHDVHTGAVHRAAPPIPAIGGTERVAGHEYRGARLDQIRPSALLDRPRVPLRTTLDAAKAKPSIVVKQIVKQEQIQKNIKRAKAVKRKNKESITAIRKKYTAAKKAVAKTLREAKKAAYTRENASIKKLPTKNRKIARSKKQAELKSKLQKLLKQMKPGTSYKKIDHVLAAIAALRKIKW